MPDASADSRVIWALRRAFLRVEARKDELMRDLPVTPAQYAVLINAAASPGATGAELARRLQVSPQNIAVLVAGLAERGLLERRNHPQHRHIRELHLTDAGKAALDAADEVVTALEREVRAFLGTDADKLQTLLDRLAKIEAGTHPTRA